jgi:hypothetical protein
MKSVEYVGKTSFTPMRNIWIPQQRFFIKLTNAQKNHVGTFYSRLQLNQSQKVEVTSIKSFTHISEV